MSKLSSPQPAELALLPTPLAFVCAGAVAALAAHLFVSTDDLTRLYVDMGVELPIVVDLLVVNPVLLPLGLLVGAVAILCGPRVMLPRSARTEWVPAFTGVAALLFTAFTALLAYSHNLVFMELQRQLQQ